MADTRFGGVAILALARDDRGERIRRGVRQKCVAIREAKNIRHVHETLRFQRLPKGFRELTYTVSHGPILTRFQFNVARAS